MKNSSFKFHKPLIDRSKYTNSIFLISSYYIVNNLSHSSISKYSSTFPTPPTKVIIVRHARTTYNEQGRYQGSSDRSILTAQGHQDAYATGTALQQYDFDAIYTSPLKRVQQTTKEIVSAFNSPNIPVYIEPKLTEVCMADWQGLYYQEVKEKYADAYDCWQNTPHLFTRNQIDYPVLELFKKAQAFWQEFLHKHRGQTILIVAHGGTNRALIGTANRSIAKALSQLTAVQLRYQLLGILFI